MRPHSLLILAAALTISCDDGPGPSTEGTLVISTSTAGDHPDPDGYLLAVDDLDTLVLTPSGTAELEVPAGSHTLQLLGVAQHCSVVPGPSLEVDVTPGSRTPVEFAFHCPGTGISVTTTTTGLDFDADGYRIAVNAVDRATVLANGVALIFLDPGELTIGVNGLAPNCAVEGPASRSVTVMDEVIVPVDFAVLCTASSGVIEVAIAIVGVDPEGEYVATVDGADYPVRWDQPTYLRPIAPGDHVVTLAVPSNCFAENSPQFSTLTAGSTVRDTAGVTFSVSCVTRLGTLRLTTITTGTPSPNDYTVWICEAGFYCGFYPSLLGTVDPNGTLLAQVDQGVYQIWLDDVPATCGVSGAAQCSIELRDTVDVAYTVSCP